MSVITQRALIVLLACGEAAPSGGAQDARVAFVSMSFTKACEQAERRDMLVLLYFTEGDNELCQRYRDLTWRHEAVISWTRARVIPIEVDVSPDGVLRERFGVRFIPTVLIVSPRGKIRASVVGYRAPQRFLREIQAGIESSDGLALAEKRLADRSGDPTALVAYAKALAEVGRYEEALQQYRRCFEDTGAQPPAFGGSKLLVIDELARLAERHPPARTSLIEIRDRSRDRLLIGAGTRYDPSVLIAADSRLDRVDESLAVYQSLTDKHPNELTTKLLLQCLVDSLLEHGRYENIIELIDVAGEAERAVMQYRDDISRAVPPNVDVDRFRVFERRAFVERMIKYYEMLVGAGRPLEAAHLADATLEIDAGAATYWGLSRAALRTGRPDKADLFLAQKAVDLADPLTFDVVANLIRTHLVLGQGPEAARAAIEMAPRLNDDRQRDALKQLVLEHASP